MDVDDRDGDGNGIDGEKFKLFCARSAFLLLLLGEFVFKTFGLKARLALTGEDLLAALELVIGEF